MMPYIEFQRHRKSSTGFSYGPRDFYTSLSESERKLIEEFKMRYVIGIEELDKARLFGRAELVRNVAYESEWEAAKKRVEADELVFFVHCQKQGLTALEATNRWKRV